MVAAGDRPRAAIAVPHGPRGARSRLEAAADTSAWHHQTDDMQVYGVPCIAASPANSTRPVRWYWGYFPDAPEPYAASELKKIDVAARLGISDRTFGLT